MTISDFDKLRGVDFETAIEGMLVTAGFRDLSYTPKSSDFGADIIASKAGRKCAIQVKRSTSPVTVSAVQEVLGALVYYGCEVGWVITNSMFTPGAAELGKRGRVELVDRKQLKQWLSKLKLEDKPGGITPRKYQAEAVAELARQRGGARIKIANYYGCWIRQNVHCGI